MIRKILSFCLINLLIGSSCFSQENDALQKKIDSLKVIKQELDGKSNMLAAEIGRLSNRKLALEREALMARGVPIYCRLETKVYSGRGTWTDLIGVIPKGTTIMAYDFKSNYYFVAFDTLNGYMMSMNVETLDKRNKKLEIQRREARQQAAQAQKRAIAEQTRKKELISKYGTETGQKISDGKIWLGMTKEMAQDSWGKPRDINRTVGSWGVKEQWVYSDAYLYFDNGILNSWQD